MLKRPSSKRKTQPEQIELNLVPILDTMVTLIAFLLFTMSFIAIVSIESPVPIMSQQQVNEQIKERPLQLTVSLRENEAEVWSPFERIPARKIPNTAEGQPDTKAIHEAILSVKQQFPTETKVVLVPSPMSTYDTLIGVMDALRGIEPTDPPIYFRNAATGNDEKVATLFPEVIFGNILGDDATPPAQSMGDG